MDLCSLLKWKWLFGNWKEEKMIMLRAESDETKPKWGVPSFLSILPESEFESLPGSLIRLMYSVANGAGSWEGWAESHHNDSHSFPLKGQLSQIEALWKELNLVKWTNPCNTHPQHLRSRYTSKGTYCHFRALMQVKYSLHGASTDSHQSFSRTGPTEQIFIGGFTIYNYKLHEYSLRRTYMCTNSTVGCREKQRKKRSLLSYDERLDWLESDDCSKWPGRWLHLCFPFAPSLIPSSLTHLHLSPSVSLCHPLSLVSSWQPINRVPLSPLMAQLLALMHFKRTAAATSQSDGKNTSSSNLHNLHPFFHPILCLCSNVLHFASDSGHQQHPLMTRQLIENNEAIKHRIICRKIRLSWEKC